MDNPELLDLVLLQLPLQSQRSCKLVCRSWHIAADRLIRRYHYTGASLDDQHRDHLVTLRLDKHNTSPSSCIVDNLHNLSRLTSLTIASDARVFPDQVNKHTGEHDSSRLCLAQLLPRLPHLQHLYIHGQDLRSRPFRREDALAIESAPIRGTDAALLALAQHRSTAGLPGLQTLDITSSPDLTDEGLAGYLATLDASGEPLGSSLVSLTLVSCPRLTRESLNALALHCKGLQHLTLKNVDGLLRNDNIQQSSNSQARAQPQGQYEQDSLHTNLFQQWIADNKQLRVFTFSSNFQALPLDVFSGFNSPSSKLETFHISSCRALRAAHLAYLPTIRKLTISGCPKLGEDLPFDAMPNLQEISYLGRALSLGSVWSLFRNEMIRKITLDAAPSAGDCTTCTPQCGHSRRRLSKACCAPTDLPAALETLAHHNILDTSLPSWALAYLLSFAPKSLESLSLHGQIPRPPMPSENPASACGYRAFADAASRSYLRGELFYLRRRSGWVLWSMFQMVVHLITAAFLCAFRQPLKSAKAKNTARTVSITRLPSFLQSAVTKKVPDASLQSLRQDGRTSGLDVGKWRTMYTSQNLLRLDSDIGADLIAKCPSHQDRLSDLLDLSSTSTISSATSPNASTRLSLEQQEWLNEVTENRIIRLSV